MAAFTRTAISAAKPGATLWDSDVHGLQARVGVRDTTFALYYRTRDGRERRPKVGKFSRMTITKAREIARRMLVEVDEGGDPAGNFSAARESPTVAELCDRYMKEHAVPNKRPSSVREDRWLINEHVLPNWGKLKATEITDRHVADLRARMAGVRVQFNRVRSLVSKMFNLAEVPWHIREAGTNPTKGIPRYPEKPRRRYMTAPEALKIARALDEAAPRQPAGVAFIKLCILTGARSGEIASARWEWLEKLPDGSGILHHPLVKTGERDIILSTAAVGIINQLPRTSGTITGMQSPRKLWASIRTKAGCPDLRMHDLRRSFASVALSAGYSLGQIGELLGHTSAQTTKRYAYLIAEAKVQAADRISQAINARMLPGPDQGAQP